MTRRLLLGMLGFAALVLALLMIPLGVANQRSERADLTRRLERDAVSAASLADALVLDDASATRARGRVQARLEDYARNSDARVVVVDAAGRSVLDTGEPGRAVQLGRDFSTRPEVGAALDGRAGSGERGSDTLGHPLLFVAVPIASGGASLGAVRISYPAAELDDRIRRAWLGLAGVAFAVLAVASLVGLVVARWIARPLLDIARVAEEVGAGDLAARADEGDGPPEVRTVASRLNASVAALERTLEDQRAFTADASHQLRTPLHALTLRLDNVAHELASGDFADAAADVDKAAIEVGRLTSLVEALLILERADRSARVPHEEIDLVEVVALRAEAWGEHAARAGVDLELDLPASMSARADAIHVEQVLDNLVDNAIGVSPSGRPVRVVGRLLDDVAELHVVDQGPGLSDEQLELVFRRFHSGAAQQPHRRGGGFGLGLAIVRRLAEVDGGTVELRHGPGRGIDAVVRYPRSSASQAAASSDA
ncbi:MAG: signal transduction histidine kinase [Thermoleophilia bacterium]|nr:signal transduction histidine kinase [Thermoleophilia bacterium]